VTDVIVLCYHALSPSWDAALSTTPERFERQLALLLRRGYRGATFSEATRAPARARLLAVTFDDAYRSVLELAHPILERLELPATVFAPTDFIGSERPMRWKGIDHWLGGPHERELTPMSWDELCQLSREGWEIGSHTASHPHLTQLDQDSLADELQRSKAVCERHLASACEAIAYPYGDVDQRVVAATARAGYQTAAALPSRLDSRDPLQWPRIGVYHADDELRFRLKVSPLVGHLRRSPAWSALDALRTTNRN
jgi:peptidoglycan/xylan/chitin deacetylase (PgdA/CDA1 family)